VQLKGGNLKRDIPDLVEIEDKVKLAYVSEILIQDLERNC
jgi:hypothetical protein